MAYSPDSKGDRKEFGNRLVKRLNDSADFPLFEFDANRFQMSTVDGITFGLHEFFDAHIEKLNEQPRMNTDWIFEELRKRLEGHPCLRPEGARNSDGTPELTRLGPQINWVLKRQRKEN